MPHLKLATCLMFASLVAAHSQPGAPLPAASTNHTHKSNSISVQEMLISGPTQLKMYSLAMISQGNISSPVDESFLPGFKVCSEDPSAPIRSITARLLGQHFVQGKDVPNPKAVAMLTKLAQDTSSDVRYNAVYHGLCPIKEKSSDLIELLINTAESDRNPSLHERIIQSLEAYKEKVTQILDRKLEQGKSIDAFEIYESFTGKQPPNLDKYLDMPSSRTRMFIIKGTGDNASELKADLTRELKAVGIKHPSVEISVIGENNILTVKTYITKEGMAVEKNFSKDGKFQIIQQMWLTPELETQFEAIRKARQKAAQ